MLEATTAKVAAVGTMNAERTGRERTDANTPPAVFAAAWTRCGECRPGFFFAGLSAEKSEPVVAERGEECFPTVKSS